MKVLKHVSNTEKGKRLNELLQKFARDFFPIDGSKLRRKKDLY